LVSTTTRSPAEMNGGHSAGGSSGASFLRKALDRTFFPELYSVRARV